MRTSILFLAVAAALLVMALPSQADEVAFSGNIYPGVVQRNRPSETGTNTTGKGRQIWGNPFDIVLGLDFRVTSGTGIGSIEVTSLGIWDDNSDGLLSPHTLMLFDLATGDLLASIATSPGGGVLDRQFRYFALDQAVTLEEGREFVVAGYYGPGNQDSNGNSGEAGWDLEPLPTFDPDNTGLIENIGLARYGYAPGSPVFPGTLDRGPANRYHAVSFEYIPSPEPGTLVLLGGAAAAAGYARRRRKKKLKQSA